MKNFGKCKRIREEAAKTMQQILTLECLLSTLLDKKTLEECELQDGVVGSQTVETLEFLKYLTPINLE